MTLNKKLQTTTVPLVMGILNVTPDSFSDGGKLNDIDTVLRTAENMVSDGVDIFDVGGESTRPGAANVCLAQELERTMPVIECLQQHFDTAISIDTQKPEVMRAAMSAGAVMINDVNALRAEGALTVAAQTDALVCIMHMQGNPQNMQDNPNYSDVVSDVCSFLQQRISACQDAGIELHNITVDPGFGFGKTMQDNFRLLGSLQKFDVLDVPLLIGVSRKSMFGKLLGRDTHKRLPGSLAGALLAAQAGAKILRVHDVKETVDVLKVWQASQEFAQ